MVCVHITITVRGTQKQQSRCETGNIPAHEVEEQNKALIGSILLAWFQMTVGTLLQRRADLARIPPATATASTAATVRGGVADVEHTAQIGLRWCDSVGRGEEEEEGGWLAHGADRPRDVASMNGHPSCR